MAQHLTLLGDSLPADVRVTSYRAEEAISRPFAFDVELATRDASFRVEACIRHRFLLEALDPAGNLRHFDGVADRVGFVTHQGDELTFRLRLRPAIAALEHREGSRIFQGKTAVDVVKQILADAGVDERVEWRLRHSYSPREFLCQYREAELSFVHRVIEEEGIFYFFVHAPDGHHLVFADHPDAFTLPDHAKPVVLAARQGGAPGTQPLLGMKRTKSLRPTFVQLRDYDFEQPTVPPDAAVPAPGPFPLRHFHYPAGFKSGPDGARRASRRISELRRDIDVCHGKSGATGLHCGAPMSVEGADEEALNGHFVLTELVSTGKDGGAASENSFAAIPKGAPFAAPRKAKKPHIHGIQTAVVTGPTNEPEAIHVDKYARIKVRFLWDRAGVQDDTSSSWLRVSQLGLGGSMILPRVGWEVSVAFLDGDPDRPIVLGRTYNAEHTPPYALPGSAADGSMKSRSTPGGAGQNEIKMGDSAGKQGMSMSAQKDMNSSTGNDKNETVSGNEDVSVGSNYKLTVGSNESLTVGGSQSIDVGNAYQVKVAGAQSTSVGGADQSHAKANFVEKVGGTRDYSIGGSQITISCGVRQSITGAFTRHVGAAHVNLSAASIDDNMMDTFTENVGAAIIQLARGPVAESVATDKTATSIAGELHVVGGLSASAKSVKQLVGGVHLRKIAADFVVSAPKIVLGGGVGKFIAAGSSISLNGGPITIKGSAISIKGAAIVKTAGNLKIG